VQEGQEGWADVSHSISCHSWIVCSCLWRPTGVGFSVLAPFFLFPLTLFRLLTPVAAPRQCAREKIISRQNNLYPLSPNAPPRELIERPSNGYPGELDARCADEGPQNERPWRAEGFDRGFVRVIDAKRESR